MTRRFVAMSLYTFCSLTGHLGGCWLLNDSPLKYVLAWAEKDWEAA